MLVGFICSRCKQLYDESVKLLCTHDNCYFQYCEDCRDKLETDSTGLLLCARCHGTFSDSNLKATYGELWFDRDYQAKRARKLGEEAMRNAKEYEDKSRKASKILEQVRLIRDIVVNSVDRIEEMGLEGLISQKAESLQEILDFSTSALDAVRDFPELEYVPPCRELFSEDELQRFEKIRRGVENMAQDPGHDLLLEIVTNFAKINVPIDTLAETKMEMIIVGSKMRAGKIGVDTGRIELLRLQQKIEWEDSLWSVFQALRDSYIYRTGCGCGWGLKPGDLLELEHIRVEANKGLLQFSKVCPDEVFGFARNFKQILRFEQGVFESETDVETYPSLACNIGPHAMSWCSEPIVKDQPKCSPPLHWNPNSPIQSQVKKTPVWAYTPAIEMPAEEKTEAKN